MRKLLIGCGILALLAFCLVVGLVVWGAIKVKNLKDTMVQMKDAYEETNRSYPFTAPEPPRMREDGLERYLRVRNELGKAVEPDLAVLNRLREASEAAQANNQKPNVSLEDLKTLFGLPKRISEAHVKALNNERLSLDEYLWYSKLVAGTTLKAAKEGKKVSDSILKAYAEVYAQVPKDAGLPPPPEGQLPDLAPMEQILRVTDVPFLPGNFQLIQDHADEVAKYPQLGFVDLFLRQQSLAKSAQGMEPTPKAEKEPATP